MENGVVFTQAGVPVKNSSDYQKVIDSRWRFMEIEIEKDFSVSMPAHGAVASSARFFEETVIYRHNFGRIPAFEATSTVTAGDPLFDGGALFADKNTIFLRRTVAGGGLGAATVQGSFRLYTLPITEEYEAPTEIVSGSTSPKSEYGMKFVDGSVPNTTPSDNSVRGFSVDTTKKILSIHKTGVKNFSPNINKQVSITAINTTTNILTLAAADTGFGFNYPTDWVTIAGTKVRYSPADVLTYPAPLATSNDTAYVIPLTATTIMLAASPEDAKNGRAIDFTTAGALPGILSGNVVADTTITHGIGYPPTFMLARYTDGTIPADLHSRPCISPIQMGPFTINRVDATKMTFFGVQSQIIGSYAYIILKDPAELAL